MKNDKIIEIGAVKVIDKEVKNTFESIIKIDIPVPQGITELTGITQEMADQGQSFSEAVLQLKEFIGNFPVIGYNITNYDSRILHFECIRNKIEYPFSRIIDVLAITRQAVQGLSSYSLLRVADSFNIRYDNHHRALDDCLICHEIYQRIFGD